jgi:poly-gamma-glutamate capsule biosynthesis protein CapA/YwtB (metallophosphatase superfamily)
MLRCLTSAGLLAAIPLACLGCSDSQAAPAPEAPAAIKPAEAAKAQIEPAPEPAPAPASAPSPSPASILISAVGDCTIGSDYRSARAPGTFHSEMDAVGDDYRYPFSGVVGVLSKDDLTIANLETTLTTAKTSIEATFVFSGKPGYAKVLTEGSVEVVNLANNHSGDFGAKGLSDTVSALKEHGVGFFGVGHVDQRTIKGVEVINLGFTGGRSAIKNAVVRSIAEHKKPENIVIVSFHWGVEGLNRPIDEQTQLGRAAVDAGADLVLGHHPHVIQGIEAYKGKHIVYSLGNFVFGGHSNPADKDSIIYQATFTSEGGKMVPSGSTVIPVRISTATDRNDYRPVILEGGERERVLARLDQYSGFIAPPREPRSPLAKLQK